MFVKIIFNASASNTYHGIKFSQLLVIKIQTLYTKACKPYIEFTPWCRLALLNLSYLISHSSLSTTFQNVNSFHPRVEISAFRQLNHIWRIFKQRSVVPRHLINRHLIKSHLANFHLNDSHLSDCHLVELFDRWAFDQQ